MRCSASVGKLKNTLKEGGSHSFQEAEDLGSKNEVDAQMKAEMRYSSHCTEGSELRTQRCGICSSTSHMRELVK